MVEIVNFPEKVEHSAELESIKRNFDSMIECQPLIARLRRASYEAHLKQGFTEDQALELCMQLKI